ncbi:endoribonuclease L-PSP [Fusarium globosum]|uniref:Endoribonuclease L-PSP n=1 Tax=Fusarium globosum TaxID=78864 RepID=A0A8H5YN88_9HYPO|nr:endoribonuclease L-PSP [Fusarium globosum]
MTKTPVYTDKAPKPRPIYNQAVVANGFVFCSGQLPKDIDGQLVGGTVQDRTRQCIRNLQHVLEAAGSSLDDVVEVNVFLSDMKNFAQMNQVYGEYWGHVKPSRTCVAVKTLPEHTDVEIKCVGLVVGPKPKL